MRKLMIVAVLVAGCVRTWADFRPYSAVTRDLSPLVDSALLAYEGDAELLRQAGAIQVGDFDVGGNVMADRSDVRERALMEAAAAGGTHVLIANEGSERADIQIAPATAVTTTTQTGAVTAFNPARTIAASRWSGNYIVLRVTKDQWENLPDGLKPKARAIDVIQADTAHVDCSGISSLPRWSEMTAVEKRDALRACRESKAAVQPR